MADPDNSTGVSTDVPIIDVLVVGGGVNGAGIAADTAGRGLSVVLCEKDDLASATSSASSKLIHGGLRYLEYYEFGLVRKALREREVLLAAAPHIIRPLRIVLPHQGQVRPAWMVRAGLFLYDHLAAHPRLPNSEGIDLAKDPGGVPLSNKGKGFAYHDAQVDDARLVVLNAVAAADHGAEILTRTRLVSANREDGVWQAELTREDCTTRSVRARALVNAAGPWVTEVIEGALGMMPEMAPRDRKRSKLRLVKGSHIIVPRLYEGDHAYLLQNIDRRVVFVMPWQGEFTLIGTTEEPFEGDADDARISLNEVDYLLEAVSAFFSKGVTRNDVVANFSGVRPLVDEGVDDMSSATRDYRLVVDSEDGQAPLLSVFGGKITTYRRLAEDALGKLAAYFPEMREPWTAETPLPGGDIVGEDVAGYVSALSGHLPDIDAAYLEALVARHGTRAEAVLGEAQTMGDLGQDFGAGLYAREIDYLMAYEWAQTAEDVLDRRTRAGLLMGDAERGAVAYYMAAKG